MATGLLIVCVGKATKVADRYYSIVLLLIANLISYMHITSLLFCIPIPVKHSDIRYFSVLNISISYFKPLVSCFICFSLS